MATKDPTPVNPNIGEGSGSSSGGGSSGSSKFNSRRVNRGNNSDLTNYTRREIEFLIDTRARDLTQRIVASSHPTEYGQIIISGICTDVFDFDAPGYVLFKDTEASICSPRPFTIGIRTDLEIDGNLSLPFTSGNVIYQGISSLAASDGFTWDNTTTDRELRISGIGDVAFIIEADTDNMDENHQSRLELHQDGGAVKARFGFYGGTNNLIVGNTFSSASIQFTGGGSVRMLLDSTGLKIGSTAPNSKLDVGGSIAFPVTETGSNTVFDATHYHVAIGATSGVRSGTLPALSGLLGRIYILSKTDSSSNVVNLTPDGTELINGFNSSIAITKQYDAIKVQALSGQWQVL